MKKALSLAISSVLGVAALASTNAYAIEGLSANASVTSNYLWRGVTQTDDGAAVQGGIDYEHSSGIYVGTWASNVDFGGDEVSGLDASYEADFYFGYAGAVGDFGYDVGYIYYAYPDDSAEIDLGEVYGSVSYSYFTVGAATLVNSGDDAFSDGQDDDWVYVYADAAFEISEGLELGLHVGNFSGDSAEDWFGDSYTDYSVSLSKGGFGLLVSKTDIDGGNLDDVKVAVSYAVDFDL
ncbi:TorF family putative porin [Corallincola spongiicola]|uniref:Histidine kinase n=1 Tax=Corallincola spongiicola TaxID=2520508 RepID=A0ABY1WQN3_9GAMM|nr:TorF family putative porin [Corallincola spongiicola]TAA46879.1 hypothetical protein EXY25_06385 [Corallincola spongiicola]